MSSEISCREKNETPGSFPGVLNTVIPFDNISLTFAEGKLKAKDIMGVWRYIHNLFIDALHSANLVDRFGRMRCPSRTFLNGLYRLYWVDGNNTCDEIINYEGGKFAVQVDTIMELADFILAFLMNDLSTESVEWMRIYPTMILVVPIIQIINQVIDARTICWITPITRNMPMTFNLDLFYATGYGFYINYDVKSRRNVISITMKNQYGNEVSLDIKSNTHNFDDFIDAIDKKIDESEYVDGEEFVSDISFSFSKTWSMSRKRKLLLSVYTPLDEGGTWITKED